MYVIDDSRNKIPCPHPGEAYTVYDVLGNEASDELIKERTGFNSYCVCLDCLQEFELDLGDEEKGQPWRFYYSIMFHKGSLQKRDARRCPKCDSSDVKTVFELVGEACPKCKVGNIKVIETGTIT